LHIQWQEMSADLASGGATTQETVMERILAIAAVGTLLAAPAFGQQVPNTRQDWSSRVHVYAPEYYAPRHESRNPNPDYQLGGSDK
jgi:hypothetical protein